MINRQLTSLTWVFQDKFLITMELFCQHITALMVQYTRIIQYFSRPFYLSHSLTKKVTFPLNPSNDALIVFPPCSIVRTGHNGGKHFLRWMQKIILRGRVVMDVLKNILYRNIYSYLKRRIFK